MADCEIDTLIRADTKPDPCRSGARRRRRPAGLRRRVPEVYVVPDGMVDIALRELGAQLVVDDSEPSRFRAAA